MRLIDLAQAKRKLRYIAKSYGLNTSMVQRLNTALSNCPTIDAVPVVRCGECVRHGACDTGWPCDITDDDDFCSCGAKMDKEEPS